MDRFYASQRWQRKREAILRRDDYKCQLSRRYGRAVQATTVHHIFPRAEFPEYSLCSWNLISLSASAHNSLHVRESQELTEKGRELLRRTARKNGIAVPEKYR